MVIPKILAGVGRPLQVCLAILFFSIILPGESVSGLITSTEGTALSGVNVWLPELQTGAATDYDGNYLISDIPAGTYRLEISSIGFQPLIRKITVTGDMTMDYQLEPTLIQLSEVTVSGTVATSENTPVTFTTIDEADIDDTHRHRDVPQLLADIPGLYIMSDGGLGLGDSRMVIRGFDEKRLQILVNNIPINHPETKEVDWAQWGMLSGVLQAVQVQRGVGTSLYGSGALGGMVNIITRDSPVESSLAGKVGIGQYGQRRLGMEYHSGIKVSGLALTANINYISGNGWRDNTAYRGLHYYLSTRILPSPEHTIKIILHGAPMLRALGRSTSNVAAYGEADQFNSSSSIDGGSGQLNGWYQYAYGFGRTYNSNINVLESDLSSAQRSRAVGLTDIIFMNACLDRAPEDQSGGWLISGERASLNNHYSHRPQLELHHGWRINPETKLTSSAFATLGTDWQDYVYPDWYIPRDSLGNMSLATIEQAAFWGGDQVFEYRDVHRFTQAGLLSAYEKSLGRHRISAGFESRIWRARHGGMVFDTFGKETVPVPVASIVHTMEAGDLFYDFTTSKPQVTIFGHGMWQVGAFSIMTNLQYTAMRFRVEENVPSNKNYPNQIDQLAAGTHGGVTWSMNGTIDHDNDSTTAEVLAEYTLWDYTRSFSYLTPRFGLNYNWEDVDIYINQSWGVKEPEIKHFFGFGSPREDIELERTVDTELGLRWNTGKLGLELAAYRITFGGKLMELTIPEKANQPGYDYAGHTYVAVGDARYQGLEGTLNWSFLPDWNLSLSGTFTDNTWGEPDYSEGAQKLYGNVALPGIDFNDTDNDGIWDEGSTELALHSDFVEKYGRRQDVGMPGLIINSRLNYQLPAGAVAIGLRHFRDIYVMEDNSEILIGPGEDNFFGTADDEFSATLPPVWLVDFNLKQTFSRDRRSLTVTLQVNNLFDVDWWQRGDDNGVLPGSPRTTMLAVSYQY